MMKNLLTVKTGLIFIIMLFQRSISDGKDKPFMSSLELSGTVEVQVNSDERLYDYIKHILTKEYCSNDHFSGLRMNKNEKIFDFEMEKMVSVKKGIKKHDYLLSYDIHFNVQGNAYSYKITNFRFCPVGKVKNDENCTQLTALSYSGKHKVKIEKQMKSIAISHAEVAIQELIKSIEQIV